ncbi:hypothetical protein NPIL_262661, partial [Nephila pilipes]
MAETSDDERK